MALPNSKELTSRKHDRRCILGSAAKGWILRNLPVSQTRSRLARWGVRRHIAREIAWSTSMSTAAYLSEIYWNGQTWVREAFDQLTMCIARDAAGTFTTTAGSDAIRAAENCGPRPPP